VAATRPEDRAWSKLRDVVAADGDRRRVGGHNIGVRVRRGMVNIDVKKSLPPSALNRLLPLEAGLRRVEAAGSKTSQNRVRNQRRRSSLR
jgi:hypothetical protein